MTEWPVSLACSVTSLFVAAILLRGVVAVFEVEPKDLVGAFGSILGGIIGAVGAALAVMWQLSNQRRDGRETIYKVIHSEVRREAEFIATRAITICDGIQDACDNAIPRIALRGFMQFPPAELYPSIRHEVIRIDEAGHFRRFYQSRTDAERFYEQTNFTEGHTSPSDNQNAINQLRRILQPALAILTMPEARAVDPVVNDRSINLITSVLNRPYFRDGIVPRFADPPT